MPVAGTGESPLSTIEDWVNVTLPDGRKGKRETNTMPQWAGSCWYYLRYIDPQNTERPPSHSSVQMQGCCEDFAKDCGGDGDSGDSGGGGGDGGGGFCAPRHVVSVVNAAQ